MAYVTFRPAEAEPSDAVSSKLDTNHLTRLPFHPLTFTTLIRAETGRSQAMSQTLEQEKPEWSGRVK